MKRYLFLTATLLAVCALSVQAQVAESTKRVERQHGNNLLLDGKLPQIQEQLATVLRTGTPVMQAQTIQTIRELTQMFPTYPFDSLLVPLEQQLTDDDADSVVRLLSALALDELHSDAGDAVIRAVAGTSKDESLRTLCSALMVRSQYR